MWTRGYLRAGHLSTMVQEGPPSRATRCYMLSKNHFTPLRATRCHLLSQMNLTQQYQLLPFHLIALLPYDIALFNAVMKCLSEGGSCSSKCFHCHIVIKYLSVGGPCSSKQPAPRVFPLQVGQRVWCPESKVTYERDESESDERDNTRSTRNTREKIPELEMIDQSTGGDLFLMFLGQGRSEFAWQTCLQT